MGQIRFVSALGTRGIFPDLPDDLESLKKTATELFREGIILPNDKGGTIILPAIVEYTLGEFPGMSGIQVVPSGIKIVPN